MVAVAGGALKAWSVLCMFQTSGINTDNSKLLIIFIGIAAVGLMVQAIALIAMAMGAVRLQNALLGHVEEIKAKLTPLIDKSHGLVTDLSPQIKSITGKVDTISGHAERISALVTEKVEEFGPTISAANVTVRQANEAARAATDHAKEQVDRFNGMISGALDATARAGRAVEHGVTRPVKEIANVIAGLKAGLETLIGGKVRPAGARPGYRPPVRPVTTYVERRDMDDLGL